MLDFPYDDGFLMDTKKKKKNFCKRPFDDYSWTVSFSFNQISCF